MNFDRYIAELLENHDCVIIPDFGGFVANYAPARINPVNNRFDPPHRKLSFNKFLTHNDGLLAAYVAKKEEESYETALKLTKEYALFLKSELKGEGKAKIDRVGMLSLNQDGSIRFQQFENANFYSDGTGLDSFFAKQIEREVNVKRIAVEPKSVNKIAEPSKKEEPKTQKQKEQPKKEEAQKEVRETPVIALTHEDSQEAEENKPRKRVAWVKVAAAAALIPMAGYAVWLSLFTPVFKSDQHFHASDLNPFKEKVCSTFKPRVSTEFVADTFSASIKTTETEEYIKLEKVSEPDKTLVVDKSNPQPKAQMDEVLRYHVIGGCFGELENAQGLANKYSNLGNKASIIDQKGALYRVSVASFTTREEAIEKMASIQKSIPGAWLLYK